MCTYTNKNKTDPLRIDNNEARGREKEMKKERTKKGYSFISFSSRPVIPFSQQQQQKIAYI